MLKKYATALIKKQWGNNMKKFGGMQLPGGITMNGQQIYEEAVAEIEKLEQLIRDTFEEPPQFIIG
jgi:gamma-glutamyl-gamma-aminobutyrate hydrolase PuuD